MNRNLDRIRGLKDLLVDAVDHGAGAVEKVHLATAKRSFDVLKAIPGFELPVQGIHAIHDASVHGVYTTVRVVTRIVGTVLGTTLDVAERMETERHDGR